MNVEQRQKIRKHHLPTPEDTSILLARLIQIDPEAYAQHCIRVADAQDEWAFLTAPPT